MKQIVIFLFLAFSFGNCLFSQNLTEEVQTVKPGEGVVTLHQEEGIEYLMEIMVKENARQTGVDGYQIQLFSGSGPKGKRQALDVKAKLLEEFPDIDITTTYNPPFWRVRVGNYRHKHEALPLYNNLKKIFPNCYVVKGSVKMNDLDIKQ